MQTIVQYLSGDWVEFLAWAIILALLALVAGRLARWCPRPSPQKPTHDLSPHETTQVEESVAATPDRLRRQQEWELVMCRAAADLARAPRAAALQAQATTKLEAAEHAYNRLVADCSKMCRTTARPTFEPRPLPPREPETPSEPQPLAA